MPKSTIAEICAAMSVINALDKRGRLAVLRELQRQNLCEPDLTKKPQEEKEGKE